MDSHHFEEEIAKGAGAFEVLVEVGELNIQSHKGSNIIIDAETQHMTVSVHRLDNTIYLRVEKDEDWHPLKNVLGILKNGHHPRAKVNVSLPADCEVKAKTITGKLSVASLDAPITTRVITGKTSLENLGGPIYAKTVTGSVEYHGSLADADHRFETTTGNVRLALSEAPDASVDARTTTGHIHCDFPLKNGVERRHITGARLRNTFGSGSGNVKARVVTGSVHFEQVGTK